MGRISPNRGSFVLQKGTVILCCNHLKGTEDLIQLPAAFREILKEMQKHEENPFPSHVLFSLKLTTSF